MTPRGKTRTSSIKVPEAEDCKAKATRGWAGRSGVMPCQQRWIGTYPVDPIGAAAGGSPAHFQGLLAKPETSRGTALINPPLIRRVL